ncbi:MAG: PilN domain-containing protein [Nitrospiraceae bacterium]|nr:MAG: PilN domain-containing protein [Nitrospiraceae bacterium]
MIRINLLPSGKKKPLVLPPSILYGILAALISIIFIIGFSFYLSKQVSAKEQEIAVKEQKLKSLQAKLTEVQNYEKNNKEVREKTEIIEQLKKKQIVPLRLLDEVSEMLPKGVWLTNLTDRLGAVSMEGYAFTNSDLVTYVQNLKNSKYFTNVMLIESRQAEVGDFSIYKFKLTFNIKV